MKAVAPLAAAAAITKPLITAVMSAMAPAMALKAMTSGDPGAQALGGAAGALTGAAGDLSAAAGVMMGKAAVQELPGEMPGQSGDAAGRSECGSAGQRTMACSAQQYDRQ